MKYFKLNDSTREWIELNNKKVEENRKKAAIIKDFESIMMAHFTLEEVNEVVEFIKVILRKKEMKGDFDYLKKKNESQ